MLAQAHAYKEPWRWAPKCVSATHGSWALTAWFSPTERHGVWPPDD